MDIFLETDKYIQEEIENLNKPTMSKETEISNQTPPNKKSPRPDGST